MGSSQSQMLDGHSRTRTEVAPLTLREIALFLDVDGTLIELAPSPDAVVVEPALIALLRELSLCTGGAVALVSGRNIPVLDELFDPLVLPAAGLHGFERRNAEGEYVRQPPPPLETLERARRSMQQVAARHPALILEDKRFSLALHYRQAPALENEVVADVLSISRLASVQLGTQRGKMVIELLPKKTTKAQAVEQFMSEAPFCGRYPVYLGDDLTDESAFEWVNAQGGLSVAVNVTRPTAARMQLGGVSEVHAWLQGLLMRSA